MITPRKHFRSESLPIDSQKRKAIGEGVRGEGQGDQLPQNNLNLEKLGKFYWIIPKFGQFLPKSVKWREIWACESGNFCWNHSLAPSKLFGPYADGDWLTMHKSQAPSPRLDDDHQKGLPRTKGTNRGWRGWNGRAVFKRVSGKREYFISTTK